MTTVKEIEKAVADLPPEKLSIFRSWFEKFDSAKWDKKIIKDIKLGKLNSIVSKVKDNYKKGKVKAL